MVDGNSSDYRAALGAVDEAVLTLDADQTIRVANEAARELFGRDELAGDTLDSLTVDCDDTVAMCLQSDQCGFGEVTGLLTVELASGQTRSVEAAITEYEGGEPSCSVILSEPSHASTADHVPAISEWTSELFECESRTGLAETLRRALEDIFDPAAAGVYLRDDLEGVFELNAVGGAARVQRIPAPEGPSGGATERLPPDTSRFLEASAERTRTAGDEALLVVGFDGVVPVGTAETLSLVSRIAERAFDRIDRLSQYRARRRELDRQKRRRGALEHVTELVRDVNRALVGASSRSEIERAVCETVAATEPYRFAWIGRLDRTTNSVDPQAKAGTADSVLAELPLSTDRTGPHAAVLDDVLAGETRVVFDVQQTLVGEGIHTNTARRIEEGIYVPLQYQGTSYGLLCVYAGTSGVFDDERRSVYDELGATIGHALHRAHQRSALTTEQVVELEFVLRDPRVVTVWLSDEYDCRVAFEGLFLGRDDMASTFLSVSGLDDGFDPSALTDHESVCEARLVSQRDGESLVELTVDSPITGDLADNAVQFESLVAEAGEARATLHLPPTADVREFVERVTELYPDTSLVRRQRRDRRAATPAEFRAELETELTDRQFEVLQLAYRAGYFAWPRDKSGESLAEVLDIAQPTFLQHVRTAEEKVMATLFDGERSLYSR